jgi:hypothetical protein
MQLRTARLCLDCEEIHDQQQCPACASETFAFISRWVPAPERRTGSRTPAPAALPQQVAYGELLGPEAGRRTAGRLLTGSAIGLAAFSVAGWLWRRLGRDAASSAERSRLDKTRHGSEP